ncbi:hypothetical protein B296_00021985 [Ensete ventricosum]|uniref:HMG box domain-containing protein n=1 Tax=Ensete ventricosum TaxID=4639 RepID=A0A427ARZ3_ENSVE|nr:hypothetical protein B296_00021985 [Ensete ventricosum]
MEVEVQEKLYPTPLHSHEEVVRDRVVFTESLRRFHSSMSTKFMYAAPSQAFSFPPTTTSASFVLRRYYLSLLHHYEQVYYFRIQGPLVPPAGPYDFTVTGSIDGKFEYGYMVTVKIGAETLRGVLYRVQQEQPSAASSSSLVAAAAAAETSHAADVAAVTRTRRRRRRGWRRRDPTHPKPNRSAYNFFFAETHSKLKALHPHREREFSKMIGESWSKLSEEERMVCRSSSLMASYVLPYTIIIIIIECLTCCVPYSFPGISGLWIEGQGEIQEGDAGIQGEVEACSAKGSGDGKG